MIKNCKFSKDENGFVNIPTTMNIRICDFGVAEIFDIYARMDHFKCIKQGLNVDNEGYHAPNVFEGLPYDARASDMWSLGMIFYELWAMEPLYVAEDVWQQENGYYAVMKGELKQFITAKNQCHLWRNRFAFDLLCQLLVTKEKNRINANAVLKHPFFKNYYKKYGPSIYNKLKKDLNKLNQQQESMSTFPFYLL